MLTKYLETLDHIDMESRAFILRQLLRMPDYYQFIIKIICFFFYVFRLKPQRLKLLKKLISSLTVVKDHE